MNKFNQEEFNEFILNNNVIGFYKELTTLKSGRKSNWYVNWRINDAYLFDKLSDYIIAFTYDKKLNNDCFYGVPEGATKIGIVTQYKWAKQSENYRSGSYILPMGRGKIKEHGKPEDKHFLGTPKGKTIIIEDVVTVGTNLLPEINKLKKLNDVEIMSIFVLTDRMELLRDDGRSVKQAVESFGVKYYSLSNALELLPQAYKKLKPSKNIAKSVEEEFKMYGIKELKLL